MIAGGYDAELLAERDIHPEEISLARELERMRYLPPPFSRYWLDLVLSPTPVDPADVVLVRPWPVETAASKHARWTEWDTVAIGAGQPLAVRAPSAAERIVCVFTLGAPSVEVTVRHDGGESRVAGQRAPDLPARRRARAARSVGAFALEFTEPVHVQFVGYGLRGTIEAAVA